MSQLSDRGPDGKDRLFTLSVIRSGLTASADEMFAVLKRAAMSPIICEVLDVGTGIADKNGRLVSSGAGIPTFVGVLDKAVKRILELHPESTLRDSDLFVTNDPYFGGVTHLNDVVVVMPVLTADRCVAWAASVAHWNDVGGRTPGSLASNATEIHQEGFRQCNCSTQGLWCCRFARSLKRISGCRSFPAAICGRRPLHPGVPPSASEIWSKPTESKPMKKL